MRARAVSLSLLIVAIGALGTWYFWNSEVCDAIVADDLDRAAELVQSGARVDAAGGCALKAAAQRGHLELVRLLLDHGADPNLGARGYNRLLLGGSTPLDLAVQSRDARVVRLLLERGADPRADYEAFTVAINFSDIAIAELLLQHGADPDMTEPPDDSVYAMVMSEGGGSLVSVPTRDVEPDRIEETARRFQCTLSGDNLLKWAVTRARGDGAEGEGAEMVGLLLKHGADPNAVDRNGRTALMLAASQHAHRVMTMLLDAGADVRVTDHCGRTAEDHADLHPPRGDADLVPRTKALLEVR